MLAECSCAASTGWGGTPLADACNHKHDAVAAFLRENGGTLGMSPTELATKLCALAAPLGQGGGGPSIVLRTLQNIECSAGCMSQLWHGDLTVAQCAPYG